MLIEVEVGQAAAIVLFVQEQSLELFGGELFAEDIWPELTKKGMGFYFGFGEDLNVRGAVEQGGFFGIVDSESKLTIGLGVAVGFTYYPFAVKLIVSVDAKAVVEVSEHSFAARFDAFYPATGEVLLEGFEMLEGEEDFGGGIGTEGAFDFVGGDADFWAFRHGGGLGVMSDR